MNLSELNFEQAIADLSAQGKGIADPGPKYDELKEKAIRDLATRIGYYAEAGPLFDSEGKYLCGSCCLREEPKACTHVSGIISMETGGCMIWFQGEPIQSEVAEKLTQIESMYSERPDGFGCSRCDWGSKAKAKDSAGRESWCSYWGMHIEPMACCFQETGKDLIEAPGE